MKELCKGENCQTYFHVNCAYLDGIQISIDSSQTFDEQNLKTGGF